ncbi:MULTISPECIES: DedA family protein [Actinopolyspora]|uniref:Membrane protein DedA, SNARE-associated domain n=1 Tax=Actinopolyspora saharensis TaxID=995062 RepID=A0A1H0YRW8_9ACTN|nr:MULTISPECIES: DedA family protein [Actinopolyspora]NHD19533.1 DedA family protein [Actinopolyspora sp. BKK2]NHE78689.1 DedA family protein [Actinopolyspora sp. BKK1]SDQ17972.1 membrane protein DedA, SNARE-associated domain [Actinopolyspora saharensis]
MPNISEGLTILAELPWPLVMVLAGVLALSECTLGLGFLVPGETALLIAGASVTETDQFLGMVAIVAGCACAGDCFGYWLGRRFGTRMRETRIVTRLGREHWDRAATMLRRHGSGAVFTARFLPVVRTLTPVAAGTSGMVFRRFLPASLLGSSGWALLHIGLGTAAGTSATYLEDVLGRVSWILFAAVALVGVGAVLWRRYRRRTTGPKRERDHDTEHSATPSSDLTQNPPQR